MEEIYNDDLCENSNHLIAIYSEGLEPILENYNIQFDNVKIKLLITHIGQQTKY